MPRLDLADARLQRLTLAVAQIAALAVVMGSTLWRGFPLDDAWIHHQVARTFAKTGTLGLYPGQPGGATSYLWAFVLSVVHLVSWTDRIPVLYTQVLNAALFVGGGQIMLGILRADGFPAKVAWIVAFLFSCAGNAVWFASSGMEATALIFLSVLGIRLWQRADRHQGSIGAGIIAALLFLLRPETVLLAPTLLIVSGRPTVRSLLRMLFPLAIAVAGYVVLNIAWTGQAMPATMAGRAWLYFGAFPWRARWERFFDVLLVLCDRLGLYTVGFQWGGFFWLTLGLALHGAWAVIVRGARGITAIGMWTLVHVATFAAFFPNIGQGGRYLPLVPGSFLAFAGLGLVSLGSMLIRPSRQKGEPRVLLTTVLCGLSIVMMVRWRSWQDCAVEHINKSEVEMGRLLATLPASARIASFDIGAISYFSHRPIVDLGGLADPTLAPMLWSGRVAEYLRRNAIQYVVLPVPMSDRHPGMANFRYRLGLMEPDIIQLSPLAHRETEPEVWLEGMLATWNASQRQQLYRIDGFGGGS